MNTRKKAFYVSMALGSPFLAIGLVGALVRWAEWFVGFQSEQARVAGVVAGMIGGVWLSVAWIAVAANEAQP